MKPILYTKNNCPNCEIIKEFIHEAQITDVDFINATNDLVTVQKMREAGIMSFPALLVGEDWIPVEMIQEYLVNRENQKGVTI